MWKWLQTRWPAALKGGAAHGATPVLPQSPQTAGEPSALSKRVSRAGEHYQFHFRDEETEAGRIEAICQAHITCSILSVHSRNTQRLYCVWSCRG